MDQYLADTLTLGIGLGASREKVESVDCCWKTVTRPHLDPLVRADAAHSDGRLRSVQQNLELGTFGVLAGTNANGDHPAGAVLTCTTHKSRSQ